MLTSYRRLMREPRPPRQEFVVVCVYCGEVIALKLGGERVPESIHICASDLDIVEQEAERLAGGGKGALD